MANYGNKIQKNFKNPGKNTEYLVIIFFFEILGNNKNNDRMRNSFEKCGTDHDERDDEIDFKYKTGDSCMAIKELMNAYSEWIERYISSCNGQRNYSHQKRRIQKWNNLFNKGKSLI